MRKIYCDCCKGEIKSEEQFFSMEIRRMYNKEIVLNEMCENCYKAIKNIVDNAESWRMSNL